MGVYLATEFTTHVDTSPTSFYKQQFAMPFKKKSIDKGKGAKDTQTILPPPPEPDKPAPLPTHPIPPRHELIFHCQLAHGSPTKQIKDFSNVKDLYARIADAFGIESGEVSAQGYSIAQIIVEEYYQEYMILLVLR